MIAITGKCGSGKTLYASLFVNRGYDVQDENGLVPGADIVATQREQAARRMRPDQIHECHRLCAGLWKFKKEYIVVDVSVRDWETDDYIRIKRRMFTVKQLVALRDGLGA